MSAGDGTTSDAGTSSRLPNLDVLRGLAALAVLVGHAYGLGGEKVPLSARSPSDALLMLSPTGVWLFFVMSGLVISLPFVRSLVAATDRPDHAAYGLRRVVRLYPLYLVCAAVVLLVLGTRGDGPGALLVHLGLLHNLVPDRQQAFINVTWTLSVEVLFYAAVPLLALLVGWRRRPVSAPWLARWVAVSAGLSLVWMLLAGALPADMARTSLWARQLLPSLWSAFCPGLLLAVWLAADDRARREDPVLRIVTRLRTSGTTAAVVGGGAALIGVASFAARPEWGRLPYLWAYDLGRVAWSVAFGVLVLRAIHATGLPARTPRALEALGTWSYGIYLIHGAAFTVLLAHDGGSLVPMPHGGTTAFVVHVLFLAGLTIPLAALSWRLVEQPSIRVARRLRRTPRPVPAVAP
ncbi:MAG: acyltransferase family protein [Actinomycetota bacterium]